MRKSRHFERTGNIADFLHLEQRDPKHDRQKERTPQKRQRQIEIPQQAAANRPHQHGRAGNHRAPGKDLFQGGIIPGGYQGIHQPGFYRTGIKGEAQPQDDGHQAEEDHTPANPGRADVTQGAHHQHRHTEQE